MSSVGAGAVIAGKYRLVSLLGKGAMGEVWRAEHTTLGAPVAIKLIDVELLGSGDHANSEIVQRFFREARAAAALRSPHVVQILDHGYDGKLPYIAMELLEGETLEQRLDKLRVLPPVMTATVITHVARAIGKAHEAGIVHRDLKPGNVFLVKNDDDEVAKVLDFGIAKATHGALGDQGGVATRTGSVVGTPCYMSPEQALGNKSIDHRADLWSLGVIAFECICGQRPFDSDALGELIVQICARPLPIPSEVVASTGVPIPMNFDAWFAKACAREPAERFQSAKELAEALRFLLASETSGLINLSMTGTSMPRIVMPSSRASIPDRSSMPGSDPSLMATAHLGSGHTMTHPGLVAAVPSTQTSSGRNKRPMVIIGAVGALVAVAVGIGIAATMGGSSTATNPAQSASGAPTVPADKPTVEPTIPPPVDSAAAAASAEAAEPAASAAATTKSISTKPITTKKTDKTKKTQGGWGF